MNSAKRIAAVAASFLVGIGILIPNISASTPTANPVSTSHKMEVLAEREGLTAIERFEKISRMYGSIVIIPMARVHLEGSEYKVSPYPAAHLCTYISNINYKRYLAGLPNDVEIKEEYHQQVLHAAVLCAINDAPSHTPPKPDHVSDSFYRIGYSGAQGSFIYTHRYENDSNFGTPEECCDNHRFGLLDRGFWFLNPQMKYTAYAVVDTGTDTDHFSAEYFADNSREDTIDYEAICYPGGSFFPLEKVGSTWNVLIHPELYQEINEGDINITVSHKQSGVVWNSSDGTGSVSVEIYKGGNYGLAFEPYGVHGDIDKSKYNNNNGTYKYGFSNDIYYEGDYHVTITGFKKLTGDNAYLDYDVAISDTRYGMPDFIKGEESIEPTDPPDQEIDTSNPAPNGINNFPGSNYTSGSRSIDASHRSRGRSSSSNTSSMRDTDIASQRTATTTSAPSKQQTATYWSTSNDATALIQVAQSNHQSYVRSKSSVKYGMKLESLQALGTLSSYPYYHDSLNEQGAVEVRLILQNPAAASRDLMVSGSVDGVEVDKIRQKFAKNFSNQFQALVMDEKTEYGQLVEIACLIPATAENLVIYHYDQTANRCTPIENKEHWVDANGYLHFKTMQAGIFIISNGVLQ